MERLPLILRHSEFALLDYRVGVGSSSRFKWSFNWYGVTARRALHVSGEAPFDYFEAEAFDHHFVAFRAVSVFVWVSGYVAYVDVVEPDFT